MLKHLQGVQQVQEVLCLPTSMAKEANYCTVTQFTKSLNTGNQQSTLQIKTGHIRRKLATSTIEEVCVCVFVFACLVWWVRVRETKQTAWDRQKCRQLNAVRLTFRPVSPSRDRRFPSGPITKPGSPFSPWTQNSSNETTQTQLQQCLNEDEWLN